MSMDYSDLSKNSVSSAVSRRSGKSLADKIRELGFNLRHERPRVTWVSMQRMDVKTEINRPSDIILMTPKLNLEQIVYYQPELTLDGSSPGKNIYKIVDFETKSKGPKEIAKISDIEVKSFKPTKKMKFRRKKRHSSIISKIDEILNRGKDPLPSRDPSEESVIVKYELEKQREKSISDLPENVLQIIFFNFSQRDRCLLLSRVCKSWYYALKDPVFWTELEFSHDKVRADSIIALINKYPSLRKLRLNSVPQAGQILVELSRCNHNITSLGVRHCNISSQDFARIILHVISCCTNLEVLDVKGMRFQSERFYLELGRLKNLKGLNFNGNKLLRNQDLITVSVNCRGLKDLRILDIASDHHSKHVLRDEDVTFIAAHLQQNLETLKIDMQQLRNVSYQAILKCSRLKCLTLKNCLHLSSDMFHQFPVLTNLKKLKMTRAINLKPEDFQFVFDQNGMERIRVLDINGCWGVGETGLAAITRRLSSLRSLSLKNCKSVKGTSLKHLAQCPELDSLNIAHTDVNSGHLLSLDKHVKNLRSLVLDPKMCNKSTAEQLKKFYPSLMMTLSFSEYRKDERPFKSVYVSNS